MENKNIKEVSIETFRTCQGKTEYISDNFVILDSLEYIPYINEGSIRLECLLAIFCMEGCIQIDIDGTARRIESGDVMLCRPNMTMSHAMTSVSPRVKVVGFSTRILQQSLQMERDVWGAMTYLHNGAILHYEKGTRYPLLLYLEGIEEKIKASPYRYREPIIHHLFSALFCELMSEADRLSACSELRLNDENIRRSNFIFKDFMIHLEDDMGRHRSVAYYAEALCITPKHLSKIVKQFTGRPALDVINERAMEHIKRELKVSDKAVKEIAEEFNFTNVSFFGKFVKAHLGQSPSRFRKSGLD